ncbi:MAG: protein mraZ [Odoribacter sp.]|nr:protein mraZ [Odoribacter sp.]MDY3032573.1 protein mraZ [Odoribacter sp.]
MCTFIGDYTGKMDNKCRVVVPASFRKQMMAAGLSVFVLRRSVFEKCIDMYPIDEWERMLAGIRAKLNLFNAKHVAFMREFCRGTLEVEMDANGRILLPRRLLDEVGIDNEMVFAGQDKMIQLWEVEEYDRVAVTSEELSDLAEEIFEN